LNCNARPRSMKSAILLTYSQNCGLMICSPNDLHSYVPESGSRLVAFNPVAQKHGACDYIMHLDHRCQPKTLKCEKQIKECN
jgi:hypothetical protein